MSFSKAQLVNLPARSPNCPFNAERQAESCDYQFLRSFIPTLQSVLRSLTRNQTRVYNSTCGRFYRGKSLSCSKAVESMASDNFLCFVQFDRNLKMLRYQDQAPAEHTKKLWNPWVGREVRRQQWIYRKNIYIFNSSFMLSLLRCISSYHEKVIKALWRACLGAAGLLSTTLRWGNHSKCLSQRHNTWTCRFVLQTVPLILSDKQEAVNTNTIAGRQFFKKVLGSMSPDPTEFLCSLIYFKVTQPEKNCS